MSPSKRAAAKRLVARVCWRRRPIKIRSRKEFFTSSDYLVAVAGKSDIARITAADPEGDKLNFSIVGGKDADRVVLDRETGILQFKKALGTNSFTDTQPGRDFDVVVEATDGKDPAFRQSITIEVAGSKGKGPPGFLEFRENSPEDTELGSFTSSDNFVVAPDQKDIGRVAAVADDGDDLRFSIVGGKHAALLNIDKKSGDLSFKKFPGKIPPSEAGPDGEFDVIVSASDGDDTTLYQEIEIAVAGPGRKGPPGFPGPGDKPVEDDASGSFTSSDNFVVAPDQKDIGRVTAVADDGDDLKFSIVGGRDADLLKIDKKSGDLSFKKFPGKIPPSEAGPNGEFEVIVGASDGDDTTFSQEIEIMVAGPGREGPPGFITPAFPGPPNFAEVPTVIGPPDFVDVPAFSDSDVIIP